MHHRIIVAPKARLMGLPEVEIVHMASIEPFIVCFHELNNVASKDCVGLLNYKINHSGSLNFFIFCYE